jgi:hypothetical protein
VLKEIVAATSILVAAFVAAHAASAKDAPKTLTGVITKFECGDNCYLTIRTATGEETGLCEAKQCVPWFENQAMPKKFIGKRVTVTTGIGKQFDGNYDVVGHTTSFKTMTFGK